MAKTLKFRTFTWPHNPATFNMNYDNRIIRHEFPDFSGTETEDMKLGPRVFSGSGAFSGAGAYAQWSQLSNFAFNNAVGILEHPKYGKFNVRLTKLTSREEPLPDYVEYDFEFIEHKNINVLTKLGGKPPKSGGGGSGGGGGGKTTTRYYTVVSGDTLGKISKKYYGTTTKWKKIADANKTLIKNPNSLKVGWKLVIPY